MLRFSNFFLKQIFQIREGSTPFNVFTHLTEEELLWLYQRACYSPVHSVVVEVGSYMGASSIFLASGVKRQEGMVYCVDTWMNDAMSEGARDTYNEFMMNTAMYKEWISPLRGYSVDIVREFDKPIDVLFLDGDHSYNAVLEDLTAWIPKLKPYGWLIMHDYGWAEGVKRVVREEVMPNVIGKPYEMKNMFSAKVVLK